MAAKGIQPIIGCSVKVEISEGREQTLRRGAPGKLPALALLAKDEPGYLNLIKLVSRAWLDHGAVSEPHVTLDQLRQHAVGLLCLTAGPDGPINQALVDGQPNQARRRIESLREVFGDRLYVELQRHTAWRSNSQPSRS
jgi:DNA polymerase-3 subunit alpha